MQYSLGATIVVLLAQVYLTYANNCTVNQDCAGGATSCGGTGVLICFHHPDVGVISGAGTCTCTAGPCVNAADCYSDPDLTCHNALRHCVDSQCICEI